jgi:SAM-dependent methyltransferase
MPSFSARLVLLINRLFPAMPMHVELEAVKYDERAYADWELREGQDIVRDFEPEWRVQGKSLLDVGSGLGGKAVLYAQLGAQPVTGIDLRPRSGHVARDYVVDQGLSSGVVRFVVCDAAQMPFRSGAFDAVVSVNVFEHVARPLEVLQESLRVAGYSGLVYLRFPPWYSPWAPHLDGWINWPWPHVFFSEKTLVEAANLIEAQKRLNPNLIASGQLDLRGRTTLPDLNRVTVRQFEQMLRQANARVLACRLVPPGSRFLPAKGWAGKAVLAVLHALVRLPVLRELMTTKIVCVLARESAS